LLGTLALRDGEFLGRPVPPFGDVRETRRQHGAMQRKDALLSGRLATQVLVHDADRGGAS